MPTIRDQLISKIPSHILENHPRFFDFMAAYYEWLNTEGNPYERLRNHLDYFTFEQSLDEYVEFMKNEYLNGIPNDALLDKELFIKWSRKFNLARGSHASYKFLFKVLFNEQDTNIYLPKDNILRSSDGTYISGQSVILTTNTNNLDKFNFQVITQEREIFPGYFEYARANVESVNVRYSSRYNLMELVVSGIEGEFKPGYPIETPLGGLEWMIPTITGFTITNGGNDFVESQRISLDMPTFEVSREADEVGSFDTRISTFLSASDLVLEVNGSNITGFEFDGRIITSNSIDIGDDVVVIFPSYEGYIVVDQINEEDGSVRKLNILDYIIGYDETASVYWSGVADNLEVEIVNGLVTPIKPRWIDNKGMLSSNMYLTDSLLYQDYSYMIQTNQALDKYKQVVKDVLHPSGFLMFSEHNIYLMLEILLGIEAFVDQEPTEIVSVILPKYGMSGNYSFFNKFKHGLSPRLYKMHHFDIPGFMEHVVGEEGYNLESDYLYNTGDDYKYDNKVGWMSFCNFTDLIIFRAQYYSESFDSGNTYFESGYVRRTPLTSDSVSIEEEEFLI